MSKHPLKTGSRLLLAVVYFAVLAAWSSNTPAVSVQRPVAVAEASDDPAWPVAALPDPIKRGFTAEGLQALDARMKEAVDKGEIAGINYALVKDDEVVAFKFLGNQSLGRAADEQETLSSAFARRERRSPLSR